MRLVHMLFWFVLVFLFIPVVALAQEGGANVPVTAIPRWAQIVISVLATPLLANVISTLVSSDRWWMKIVDLLAFNWLKARNDPTVQ